MSPKILITGFERKRVFSNNIAIEIKYWERNHGFVTKRLKASVMAQKYLLKIYCQLSKLLWIILNTIKGIHFNGNNRVSNKS